MAEDPVAARAALEAEAERLRLKRVGDEAAKVQRVEAYQNEKRAAEKAVSPKHLRKALNRVLWFWAGLTFIFMGVMWWAPKDPELTPIDLEHNRRFMVFASAAGVALLAWHYTAVMRSQIWRNRLPFKLVGFEETLGIGASVTEIAAVVQFKDTAAKQAVVAELVKAHLEEEATVSVDGGQLRIASGRLDRAGSNYPAAGWVRKVIAKVLQDVHRGYPIESVQFFAVKTDEFYVPSGD
jgi:hypothetical protein